MRRHKRYPYVLLTLLCGILIFLIWPPGTSFGSETDWVQQHIKIADYFRTLFYSNGQLLPDYAPHLASGTNIYALSYYGLFRPDVLLSYLLPFLKMETIVVGYIMLEFTASVNLCYLWLRKHGIRLEICMTSAAFLAMSSLLFQSHRQIMFINYMPYLFLALLAADSFLRTGRIRWLTLASALIILHSYFFSVTALLLISLYFLWRLAVTTEGKLFTRKSLGKCFRFGGGLLLSTGMCAMLLLPTAYYMLQTRKDSGEQIPLYAILGITPSMKGMLYWSYGAGLSIICLLILILALQGRKTRLLSVFLIVCMFSNTVSWLLNGTLYIRYKIYLVFLPFLLYAVANTLQEIYEEDRKWNFLPLLLSAIPLAFVYFENPDWLILADALSACFLLFLFCQKKQPVYLALMLLLPFVLCIRTNRAETFPKQKEEAFTNEEISRFAKTYGGRFLDTTTSLLDVNTVSGADTRKTTMYSSLSNSAYNHFYYDIMRNPVSIKNRVAFTSDTNLLFQLLMNVTSLKSKESELPLGYQIVEQRENTVLAATEDALPKAYATSDLYNSEAFGKLAYPDTIDVLMQSAVVENGSKDFQKQMQQVPFTFSLSGKKGKKQTVNLPETYENKVLLLSFDIDRKDGREVEITINGTKNKLSGVSSNYPNGNTTFTYVLAPASPVDRLDIRYSMGDYEIRNVTLYALDYGTVRNRRNTVDSFSGEKTSGKEILKGQIDVTKDGYFITSIPYEKGLTAYVDGEETSIETVSTCFAGFPVTEGNHEITIEFHAPFKQPALVISVLSFAGWLIIFIYEGRYLCRRKHLPNSSATAL